MATSMIRKAIAQRLSGVSLNSRETANLNKSNLMAGAAKIFLQKRKLDTTKNRRLTYLSFHKESRLLSMIFC